MDKEISFRIHPALGVARVGDSQEYFFAPEVSDYIPPAGVAFKDSSGAVKRQAAHFRVYRYRGEEPVEEITETSETHIAWRVQLANRKAAWYRALPPMDLGNVISGPSAQRNPLYSRSELAIVPRPGSITGVSQPPVKLDDGSIRGTKVYLGELRTDAEGRLIVLGGLGECHAFNGSKASDDDNEGWYDDTSDGPVRATITFRGDTYEAEPAMVLVGPPNFCQGLAPIISLYDVAANLLLPPITDVSFWTDIYPLFEKLVRCQWANEGIFALLGAGSPADLTLVRWQSILADPSNAAKPYRQKVFSLFRDPASTTTNAAALPPIYGDGYDHPSGSLHFLSVTPRQYQSLQLWADGNFVPGTPIARNTPLGSYPVSAQPAVLDRAALDDMVGGAFHPGVEAPWILRLTSMWKRPFRLKVLPESFAIVDNYGLQLTPAAALANPGPATGAGPGTLTRWMSVPWQTDTMSCHAGYSAPSAYLAVPTFWVSRVPNFVLSDLSYQRVMDPKLAPEQRRKHFHLRQIWWRDIAGASYEDRMDNATKRWKELGIVAPRTGPGEAGIPDQIWVETSRAADAHPDPTLDLLKSLESL